MDPRIRIRIHSKMSCIRNTAGGSIDQWVQIPIAVIRSIIRIRIHIKMKSWIRIPDQQHWGLNPYSRSRFAPTSPGRRCRPRGQRPGCSSHPQTGAGTSNLQQKVVHTQHSASRVPVGIKKIVSTSTIIDAFACIFKSEKKILFGKIKDNVSDPDPHEFGFRNPVALRHWSLIKISATYVF